MSGWPDDYLALKTEIKAKRLRGERVPDRDRYILRAKMMRRVKDLAAEAGVNLFWTSRKGWWSTRSTRVFPHVVRFAYREAGLNIHGNPLKPKDAHRMSKVRV